MLIHLLYPLSLTTVYSGTLSPSSPSHQFELIHHPPSLKPHGLSPAPVFPIIKRLPLTPNSVISRSSSPDLNFVVLTTMPQDETELFPRGILVTVQKQSSIDRNI